MTSSANRRRLVNAALIVGVLFLLSRILGFVRQAVFGYFFGADTLEAEAFALVVAIPDLVFAVIAGGALGSAFIPVFVGFWADPERPDEEGGWQLFSAVLTLVMATTVLSAAALAWWAPQLLVLLYPEKVADDLQLLQMATLLLRVMLLGTVVFGASGVVMAALNARQHFTMPALATVVYNLGIILGILIWQDDVLGVGYGTVLGALGHLAVQLPPLWRLGARYRPLLTVRAPAVQQVLRLMAPRVLGLSFSYLNPLFTPFVAQTLPRGSLAALFYAYRVMLMPQGVLGQALGVASFPTFAALAAQREYDAMRRLLGETARLIVWAGLPLSAALMVLREPFITLFLERGRFDSRDTALVAAALLTYMPALIPLALIEVVVRVFYALRDTVTPVWTGAAQIGLMVGLSLWLGRTVFPAIGRSGVEGVALGFSLSNWLELALLLWLLGRRLPGGDAATARVTRTAVLRMATATLPMVGAMQLALWRWGAETTPAGLVWQLGAVGALGAAVYLAASYLLGVEELRRMLGRFRRARSEGS